MHLGRGRSRAPCGPVYMYFNLMGCHINSRIKHTSSTFQERRHCCVLPFQHLSCKLREALYMRCVSGLYVRAVTSSES